MALTDFASLSNARKQVWSAMIWRAGRDTSFYLNASNGFLSSGTSDSGKPIHFVKELTESERGAKCIMHLTQDLGEDGVVDDEDLDGNEEAIAADDIEINLSQLRHAVKNRGQMSEQRTVIRFRAEARDKLGFWYSDRLDELFFLTGAGMAYSLKLDNAARAGTSQWPNLAFAGDVAAPTSNRIAYAGTATSTATLAASEKMTWNLLVKIKTIAMVRRIKPIKYQGRDTYCVVMSPEQARDLRMDSDYRTIVAQAGNRGDKNPLFTGAFAQVEGLALFEHNKVPTTKGLASGSKWGVGGLIEGAQAVLHGAQSLGFARIGNGAWVEGDKTDYENRVSVGYRMMFGMVKPQFKSIYDKSAGAATLQDFSTIVVRTAAAE